MLVVIRSRAAISAFVALTAGCVTNSTTRPPMAFMGEARIILGEDDIARSGVRTAHEAIQRLRAEYVSVSRTPGANESRIYVDGLPVSGIEALRGIPSTSIYRVLWLSAGDATTRFGTGHSAGAIVIVTKLGR